MKAVKTVKQVQIVATYYHKKDGKLTGVVTYLVKSSDGKSEYCTTLVDGKATGCSCPASRGKCYHRTQLEAKAVARKEVASQFSAKHVPSWLVELVAKGVLVAPVKVMPTQTVVSAKVTDISTKGALTCNTGFSLLKVG